ncbi:DUF2059 domain-containing protein [Undibacterium rugosum]|uniref:DUF2059 domain-containing protein n=1 Tax=Undibacterium rugosum TaxID=2762291 RepID=A0A923KRM7_9BURK|nr:DUF2059 domain-containing protein [Undibacterium rugosum]MBC3934009.1 DUF2059 domain-containing protein [Undibacterium rugosum]MBR7777719.1 DUF2059 domain-containing protein [Undibacterium rugosum]
MKIWTASALSFLLVSGFAYAEKPTEQSVKEFLEVSKGKETFQQIEKQLDTMLDNFNREADSGKTADLQKQKAVEKFKARVLSIRNEAMDWDKLESMFIGIYQDSLSQEEIDGLIQFYRSPVGQASLTKMPQIMLKTNQQIQVTLLPMMDKIKLARQDLKEEFEKIDKKKK